MYIYMFSKLKCHDLKWLRTGKRLSLQVYESHIYVYDEINLYEQLVLHFSLFLSERKLNFEVF